MNLVRDTGGGISFGLVDVNVYFSRITGKLSTRLGTALLNDLQQALEAGERTSYFSDASELTSYDLLARSAFVRLLLSNRKRFSEIVILNWAGGGSAGGQALAATIGDPVVMLTDRYEFERRLTSIAPRAAQVLRVAGASAGAGAEQGGFVAEESPTRSASLRATRS